MTYLSEDPTFLAGGLLLLAAAFGLALKATQQGKYLIRALVALGLAAAVVVIEWMWVTDSERIEQTVYDLRQAALSSDVDGLLSYMAPDVRFQKGETSLDPEATRALIQANLGNTRFEFIRISNLQISVGEQSRRGKAEFRVFAKGSLNTPVAMMDIGTFNSVWSLGFQETKPHIWKVNRITPVQLPSGGLAIPSGAHAPNYPPDDGPINDGSGMHRPHGRVGARRPVNPQDQSSDSPGRRPGRD
jgi:hypothetical protein